MKNIYMQIIHAVSFVKEITFNFIKTFLMFLVTIVILVKTIKLLLYSISYRLLKKVLVKLGTSFEMSF